MVFDVAFMQIQKMSEYDLYDCISVMRMIDVESF